MGESVKAKSFCCAFKLGSLKLICKASLILRSNLELALSVILKERELYWKQVAVACKCLKIWELLCFLVCFSILVLKMTSFANVIKTAASTIYILGKISNYQELGIYIKNNFQFWMN